jgi:hypothetical protein
LRKRSAARCGVYEREPVSIGTRGREQRAGNMPCENEQRNEHSDEYSDEYSDEQRNE